MLKNTHSSTLENPIDDAQVLEAGPRSLYRTLRILEYIAQDDTDFTLARLAVELEIPKSSLHGLLGPLARLGYVVQERGSYSLGPSSYRLGLAIVPSLSIGRIAAPLMRELVELCNETVLIATLDRAARRVNYVEKLESSRSVRYTVPLGTSRPLYCSAAGRILLAYSDDEYIAEYLRTEPLPALTPQTLTEPKELRRELIRIREAGVAITSGEVSSDVAGFAAPIFDNHAKVVAALVMAAPVSRSQGSQQNFIMKVKAAAESISFGMGYPGAQLQMIQHAPTTKQR